MKTTFLRLAIVAMLLGARAALGQISYSVGPTENGSLIYAPMGVAAAGDAATGRLYLRFTAQNLGPTSPTITSIRVICGPVDVSFARNVVIAPYDTTTTELTDDRETGGTTNEIVTLPHPAPANITIRLYFAGDPTPLEMQRTLAPYVPTTPGGQYLYPADEGDIGPNEYFSDGIAHTASGGQGWGADWKVYRVIAQGSTSTLRPGGISTVNEDHLGWGVPMRAIADGVVLKTSTGWINNPTAGTRAFQMLTEYNGEPINDVKVTRLGPIDIDKPTPNDPARAASLVRLPAGNFELTVWQMSDRGFQLTRLGSSTAEDSEDLVTNIAMDGLYALHEEEFPTGPPPSRLVTAFRLTSGALRLVTWDISSDGLTVDRRWEHDEPLTDFSEVSMMKMNNSRFATAVRDAGGNLRVAVWELANGAMHKRAEDTAGGATFVNITALSETRLMASMRDTLGRVKVIVWDYTDGAPGSLTRRGEATGETVTRVVAARATHEDENDVSIAACVTAVRTNPGGLLKVMRWVPSADGETITRELDTAGPAILDQALAMCPAATDNVTTASVLAGNVFKINGWGNDPENSPDNYEFSAQNQGGTVDRISIDEASEVQFFVGARTLGGNLKIMVWHWAHGGGNSVYVLHGDCRVLYAHFQDGSVDTDVLYPGATVAAGQVLGLMGNSGSSGGPHTHINSDRISPITSIEDMIAKEAVGALPIIGPRPMPFSGARAMRLANIAPGGEGNAANSFATLNNQGMYDVSLGIRPRLNTRYVDPTIIYAAPNGRKEPTPGNPATGGPMPIPSMALGIVPSGGRLYIRGRSYDEAITFSTPMVVRRYDYYETGGPVVIGK